MSPPLDDLERKEFEAMRTSLDRFQLQLNDHQTQSDRMAIALDECKSSLHGIRDRVGALSDRLATMDHRDHKMATDLSIVLESLQAQSNVLDALRKSMKESRSRRGPRRKHG